MLLQWLVGSWRGAVLVLNKLYSTVGIPYSQSIKHNVRIVCENVLWIAQSGILTAIDPDSTECNIATVFSVFIIPLWWILHCVPDLSNNIVIADLWCVISLRSHKWHATEDSEHCLFKQIEKYCVYFLWLPQLPETCEFSEVFFFLWRTCIEKLSCNLEFNDKCKSF